MPNPFKLLQVSIGRFILVTVVVSFNGESYFTNLNTDKDFIFSLLAMSTITVVYIIIFYVLAITIFRKIQF